MFGRKHSDYHDLAARAAALDGSLAVVEFGMDGQILAANGNFLSLMGYTLEEIRNRHHRIFLTPGEAASADYARFWRTLANGGVQAGTCRRTGKNGRAVWLHACYNPVLGRNGKPTKVIKIASDVTTRMRREIDLQEQLTAIDKSQAVISFDMDGTILDANANFLQAVGYTLAEIRGQHHRIFAEPSFRDSSAYQAFWATLRRGELQSGEFLRLGKDGREVWLQASYTPICDHDGRPTKVMKLATVITQQKLIDADNKGLIEAISKVQGVIHFALDGTILTANDLFLRAMGYTLAEIRGRHHRMFVDPSEAASEEYERFWASLRAGRADSRVFRRIGRGGTAVWIQASYNPIFDQRGRITKIVKYATEVTGMIDLAEMTSVNVQGVAAATETLSASIREINNSVGHSREATALIADKITVSGDAATALVETMHSMEGIVHLIQEIAGRVSLLSLNATIEAARAGESGKGFAVVASEVKTLANQTAAATREITDQITKVQQVSASVAGSIQDVVTGVRSVNDHVASVAAAIEAQSTVTQEISRSSQQTSDAVADIMTRLKQAA